VVYKNNKQKIILFKFGGISSIQKWYTKIILFKFGGRRGRPKDSSSIQKWYTEVVYRGDTEKSVVADSPQ
jgi:hypothetical protein